MDLASSFHSTQPFSKTSDDVLPLNCLVAHSLQLITVSCTVGMLSPHMVNQTYVELCFIRHHIIVMIGGVVHFIRSGRASADHELLGFVQHPCSGFNSPLPIF